MNHGAVARDIDKTREVAKELGVEVSPAPASTHTLNRCLTAFERAYRELGRMYSLKRVLCESGEQYIDSQTQEDYEIWDAAWHERPSEIRLTQEEWADKILADFQTENNRTKTDEWEACYAHLFKQLNEVCGQKREIGNRYQAQHFKPCDDYRVYQGDDRHCPVQICKTMKDAEACAEELNDRYYLQGDALQEAVAMADEARKYLLEHPSNKVKCNIMLLWLVQKFSKDPTMIEDGSPK
jgi:hypothetical protein